MNFATAGVSLDSKDEQGRTGCSCSFLSELLAYLVVVFQLNQDMV